MWCNYEAMISKCYQSIERARMYLTHETGDDAMKYGALVAKTLLSSAQCTEVFCKTGTSFIIPTSSPLYPQDKAVKKKKQNQELTANVEQQKSSR